MPLILVNSKDCQDQKTNLLKLVEKSCHKNSYAQQEGSNFFHVEVKTNVIF